MALEQAVAEALPGGDHAGAAGATPAAPDPAAAAGLTAREAEVLRLLAEGRTDREIGAALFISDKTASRHVANILLKLGVGTRTAAAAYAHRHGLA